VGESNPKPAGGVSTGRILLVAAPLAIIVIVAFVAYVFGGLSFVNNFFQPKLVAVKGLVYWNGEILEGGTIETEHETPGVRGASGNVNTDGSIALQTMVNGQFVDGVYAGRHKVIIRQVDRTAPRGASMPPPSSPEKYLTFKTTDLEIDVSRDPAKNNFKLEMLGKGPKGQTNSKEETQAAKNVPKAPVLSPHERALKLMADNDADKDGKLSPDEQRGLGFQFQKGLIYADKDKDGSLSLEELESMVL